MSSLFRNLLKVVSTDRVPLEDYFTEIFSYLLKSNSVIMENFLKFFSLAQIENWEEYYVRTQETFHALTDHSVDSRPDIYVELSKGATKDILLIECKIDTGEGDNQLKQYAEHLDHLCKTSFGTLVYITRDYDRKEYNDIFKDCRNVHQVQFIQLRWYQIYSFLKKCPESFLVQEVLTFMEVMNMAVSNQFNMVDILALTNFPRAHKMMQETLSGEVRIHLESVLKKVSTFSESDTQLRDLNRFILVSKQKEKFWCGLGYWIDPANMANYPSIEVRIEVPPHHKERKYVIKIMHEIAAQGKWQGRSLTDTKAWSSIYQTRSLQHYVSNDDHIKSIQKQFINWIDDILVVKNSHPDLPWR